MRLRSEKNECTKIDDNVEAERIDLYVGSFFVALNSTPCNPCILV